MKTLLQIIPMEQKHIAALCELEKQCFVHPWSEQSFAEELDNPTARFFVAILGDALVGYIGANNICSEVYITDVAVDRAHRRQGIARELILHLCDCSVAEGASFITLEVRKSNAAAIGLYQKCGFENMGVRPGFYTDPDEDAFIMTKDLSYGEKI